MLGVSSCAQSEARESAAQDLSDAKASGDGLGRNHAVLHLGRLRTGRLLSCCRATYFRFLCADFLHAGDREFCRGREARRMDQPGARLCQYPLQPARPDQCDQCRKSEARLVVLRRHAVRPRGRRRWWSATPCIWSRPIPNIAYALDLTKPGPSIKWTYQPNPSPIAIGKACCDAVLRGWAYADGKLIYNLLDDETVAVDAKTGKQVWRTRLDDPGDGVTMTMSRLYRGRQGLSSAIHGGEMGVNGWLAALDVKTGKELWRAYAVGPDSDVLIGAGLQAVLSVAERQGPGRHDLAGEHVEARRAARPGAGSPTIQIST